MTEVFVSIEKLLLAPRAPDHVVALSDEAQVRSWESWVSEVTAWATHFSGLREQAWALHCTDSAQFSVLFFGLLQANKSVYLAPNNTLGTLTQMAELVEGFAGDFPELSTELSPELSAKQPHELAFVNVANLPETIVRPEDITPLDDQRPCIFLFTSGTSGQPSAIPKTLGQLGREVLTLEQTFGETLGKATAISTVSHQHIYGLLFKVLWPLASGRAFHAGTCHSGEDIIRYSRKFDDVLLVSSPSHLSRLTPATAWDKAKKHIRQVFSSTAPLSREAAQKTENTIGLLPVEVYGSSETGGVAYRQQKQAGEPWRVFDGLEVKADQSRLMSLRSPHLPNADWVVGEDLVVFEKDGRFHLQGRVDKLIKVEGKRVSLAELEKCIGLWAFSARSRALVLSGSRDTTAAVIELNEVGVERLRSVGKVEMVSQLRRLLQDSFEPVVIPKRYQFVSRIPIDALGKTPVAMLENLFAPQALINRLPKVRLIDQRDESLFKLEVFVQESMTFFEGHFQDHPVLPGVAMVFWVEHFSRTLFGVEGQAKRVRKLKFQKVVRPGAALIIEMFLDKEQNSVRFSVTSETAVHASGQLVFVQ